ncbi:hypothetical protein Bpfe_012036 [Biomphalaria pfeifferi]|uniref:Uncharacterized protein n=1 Tax=Biomphalaria pfeifferi TaxID=112525 RepID=A0AAD8BPF0_BIOPF|nr:hypothetical protein Bpfe_012036 [Biomphalaria pfeifferi]
MWGRACEGRQLASRVKKRGNGRPLSWNMKRPFRCCLRPKTAELKRVFHYFNQVWQEATKREEEMKEKHEGVPSMTWDSWKMCALYLD